MSREVELITVKMKKKILIFDTSVGTEKKERVVCRLDSRLIQKREKFYMVFGW